MNKYFVLDFSNMIVVVGKCEDGCLIGDYDVCREV